MQSERDGGKVIRITKLAVSGDARGSTRGARELKVLRWGEMYANKTGIY